MAQPVAVIRSKPDTLGPEVRGAWEASWERNQTGYRYLAGR